MDRGRLSASPSPGLDTLGSMSIHFPTEGVSLSSQSGLPLRHVRSPIIPVQGYSDYTPQSPTRLSPNAQKAQDNRENVIGALKKLQDKIRQLEVERSAAEGNLRTLANETTKYRDLLNRDRMETSRPYAPQQSEVSRNTQELQAQLNCAESRCGLLEKQLEYMRKMVQDAEADKLRLIDKQREQASKIIRDDETLKARSQKLCEIERDHLKLSAHQTQAERKIQDLESKLSKEIVERQKTEERLKASLSPKITRPEEKRKLKKKVAPKAKSAKVQPDSQRLHYHLNLNEMPFLHGKSTSPSHNVSANVQKVLSLLKSHNNVMCQSRGYGRVTPTDEDVSPSSTSSSESDLNELILQLQDEYAQMGFEHQELSGHLAEETNEDDRNDLERELELLTAKMEIKSEQIQQLKHHLQHMEKKKVKRTIKTAKKQVTTPRTTTLATARRSQRCTQHQASVPSPPTRKTPSTDRDGRLQILRDMKKLQSTLRPDDLSWDC